MRAALPLIAELRQRLVWPLPALAAWGSGWAAFLVLGNAGVSPWVAVALASILAALFFRLGATRWRRILIVAGFPASLVGCAAALLLPPWAWLVPFGVLFVIYPRHAWRDAPVFPTPSGALHGLSAAVPLRSGARVLDAGCGLGDALVELHREYPQVRLGGVEWSWLLARICAWRCGYAQVRRGDIWTTDWSEFDLVYLFQRPESMPRALAKARAEMKRGAWLASLEFEIPGLAPAHVLDVGRGRPLWLYRVPFAR
ncbi:MAG: class I SAM-dependent methyltransferase [Proteobacteria bacterium]|nr:class I SAM-dependent methyltransferase [Pseudomonadota bacterium]